MKSLILVLLFINSLASFCQENDSSAALNLNLPISSPGFIVLGVEPTTIERPATLPDFTFSILHSTNNFSNLPRNFAIDFLPFWIFAGKNITYQDFISNEVIQNIKQSLNISLAVANQEGDTTNSTSVGMGIKFSILRGEVSNYQSGLHHLRDSLNNLINLDFSEKLMTKKNNDSVLIKLAYLLTDLSLGEEAKVLLLQAVQIRTEQIRAEVEQEVRQTSHLLISEIKNIASLIKFKRYGFKLDAAAGLSLNFPTGNFDFSNVDRFGAWLTGGYDTENNFSILAAARLFYRPNFVYKNSGLPNTANDVISLDAGVKLLLDDFYRFSIAGEFLYQKIINNKTIEGSTKYDLSILYSITNDYLISFTIGKDFDNTIRKGGNLITAINLLLGFGSQRPI